MFTELDNGGIREAYRAYHKHLKTVGTEPQLPGLSEFSLDQVSGIYYSDSRFRAHAGTAVFLLVQLMNSKATDYSIRRNLLGNDSEQYEAASFLLLFS